MAPSESRRPSSGRSTGARSRLILRVSVLAEEAGVGADHDSRRGGRREPAEHAEQGGAAEADAAARRFAERPTGGSPAAVDAPPEAGRGVGRLPAPGLAGDHLLG